MLNTMQDQLEFGLKVLLTARQIATSRRTRRRRLKGEISSQRLTYFARMQSESHGRLPEAPPSAT